MEDIMESRRSRHPTLLLSILLGSFLVGCGLSDSSKDVSTSALPVEIVSTPTIQPIYVRIPRSHLPPEEFAGYYTASFEVSSFTPCSDDDLPGYGKGYWIDVFRSPGFHDAYYSLLAENNLSPDSKDDVNAIAFVRFMGSVINPAFEPFSDGAHGHMGLYKLEIWATEIIDMVISNGKECDAL